MTSKMIPKDNAARRAAVKQRASAARAFAAATKSWVADARAATQGTMWRVTHAWIEECDRTPCAELVHVSTGKSRVVRMPPDTTNDARRAELLRVLSV